MRGRRDLQTTMLAVVDLEERVPPKHPLRVIKQFADGALVELSPVFDEMYGAGGRPSIPPERLLKASLLISLYSVRSERAFCEELDYHLLFRWFLDMGLLESSFDPTVFTKNRRRLLKHDVAQRFFDGFSCNCVGFWPELCSRGFGCQLVAGRIRPRPPNESNSMRASVAWALP